MGDKGKDGHYNYPGSEMTPAAVEFALALDRYKRRHQRPFPTCSEVLQVLLDLGYTKAPTPPAPPA